MPEIDSTTIDSLLLVIHSLENIIDEKSKGFQELRNIHLTKTWISSAVIIGLFLMERFINHYLTQQDRKNQWFMNIIAKPNLDKIINFYSDAYDHIETSIQEINAMTNTSATQLGNASKSKLKEFKKKKVNFDHAFISLVRSQSKEKANKLTGTLNRLEDIITKCFTTTNTTDIDLEEQKREIHENKSMFFEILYSN